MTLRTACVVFAGSIGSRYLRVLSGMIDYEAAAVPVSGYLYAAQLAEMVNVEKITSTTRSHVKLLVITSATASPVQQLQSFRVISRVATVEKPLTGSAVALESVHLWPRAAMAFVSVPHRFTRVLQEVERVLSGVGWITFVRVVCLLWLQSWRPHSNYRMSYAANADHGTAIPDLIHDTIYCLRLFGPPWQVSALRRSDPVVEVPSGASVSLFWRFDEFDVKMDFDFLPRPTRRGLYISGTRRSIVKGSPAPSKRQGSHCRYVKSRVGLPTREGN